MPSEPSSPATQAICCTGSAAHHKPTRPVTAAQFCPPDCGCQSNFACPCIAGTWHKRHAEPQLESTGARNRRPKFRCGTDAAPLARGPQIRAGPSRFSWPLDRLENPRIGQRSVQKPRRLIAQHLTDDKCGHAGDGTRQDILPAARPGGGLSAPRGPECQGTPVLVCLKSARMAADETPSEPLGQARGGA